MTIYIYIRFDYNSQVGPSDTLQLVTNGGKGCQDSNDIDKTRYICCDILHASFIMLQYSTAGGNIYELEAT